MAKAGNPEKVGYCNPPKSGQIKPREIRNPWGCRGKKGIKNELGVDSLPPTGKDAMADAIITEMLSPVTVMVNGKPEVLPVHQALLRKLNHGALSTETSAALIRVLFDRLDKAFDHKDKRHEEFVGVLQELKRQGEELVRIAKANNAPVDIAPHPEDIVVDPLDNNRIDGPANLDEKSIEYDYRQYRNDAEAVMEASFAAYWQATSDEERDLHRHSLEHAVSVWRHYNERVSRRVRRPQSVLAAFTLDGDGRGGSLRVDRAILFGKMDRTAFIDPRPPEDSKTAENKRLEKEHYRARAAIQFDIGVCVDRCRNSTFEGEKARYREELDQLKREWLKHNARVNYNDRWPVEIIEIWDPDKPVVEPTPPNEPIGAQQSGSDEFDPDDF